MVLLTVGGKEWQLAGLLKAWGRDNKKNVPTFAAAAAGRRRQKNKAAPQ